MALRITGDTLSQLQKYAGIDKPATNTQKGDVVDMLRNWEDSERLGERNLRRGTYWHLTQTRGAAQWAGVYGRSNPARGGILVKDD